MTTLPIAADAAHVHEASVDHHAPHHEEEHDRPGIDRLGLLLFMASESMLFIAMAAARLYLAGFDKGEVNLPLGLVMTVILLTSSWFGYRAVAAVKRGDRGALKRSIGAAILLGIVFVSCVVVEWHSATFAQSTAYGTAFFALTGLHVFHMLQGLLGLVLLLNLVRKGQFGPDDHWGVTAVTRYWTFVDIMWLVIVFPVLYLL